MSSEAGASREGGRRTQSTAIVDCQHSLVAGVFRVSSAASLVLYWLEMCKALKEVSAGGGASRFAGSRCLDEGYSTFTPGNGYMV